MSLELTVRVGNQEALSAAVQTGANSVYLSFPDSQSKDGFTQESILDAVKFCTLRGVKAYINFPYLYSDSQLLSLRDFIVKINSSTAAGVAAGDLGLIRMIRTLAPALPIHGNELLAVSDLSGALAAEKLGLKRITFARELSLQQMQFICKRVEIETQAFCHGEQCVSYSGQCYMSALLTSRSANKGKCMHPCKMAYSYFGDIPAEHLSLKDMCLVSHLQRLEDAGVCAGIIDERNKRAEETALVTSMYSDCLKNHKSPSRMDMMNLESLFARDGFNDSYIKGEKGTAMFGIPNPAPEREAKQGFISARKLYQGEGEKPLVAVDIVFKAHEGEKMALYCRDEQGNESHCVSSIATFSKKGASLAEVREWLKKTEKTVFYVRQCSVDMDEGLKITPAAVAAMRRSCLDALALRRKQAPERAKGHWQPGLKRLSSHKGEPKLALSFLKTEQITSEILNTKPEIIYLPMWRMQEDMKIIELLLLRSITPCAVLDRVISDKEWPDVLMALRELKEAGLSDVMCQNVGQCAILAPLGFNLHGDFGLNIHNSQSIKELKGMGLSSCTLSFEMSFAQIKELSLGLDCQIIAYGRLPLMLTENCIIHKHHGVHTCHNGAMALIDKTGRSYPLLPEKGCRNTLYNAEKLWLADKRADYKSLGLKNVRLCFTTENSKECLKVIEAYLSKTDTCPERITRGMYYRGN